jgi:hypothetical protein
MVQPTLVPPPDASKPCCHARLPSAPHHKEEEQGRSAQPDPPPSGIDESRPRRRHPAPASRGRVLPRQPVEVVPASRGRVAAVVRQQVKVAPPPSHANESRSRRRRPVLTIRGRRPHHQVRPREGMPRRRRWPRRCSRVPRWLR